MFKFFTRKLHARIAELEKSDRLCKSFVASTSDLFYRTDTLGKIIFISGSVNKISGYTIDEALGMKMAEQVYYVPEERQAFLELLSKEGEVKDFVARLKRKDGSIWWASTNAHFFRDENGEIAGVEGITRDITQIVEYREKQNKLIEELKEAMAKIQTLSGLLPICASCKKVRDDKGYWNQIENYIRDHSKVEFNHGICPECADELYPQYTNPPSNKDQKE